MMRKIYTDSEYGYTIMVIIKANIFSHYQQAIVWYTLSTLQFQSMTKYGISRSHKLEHTKYALGLACFSIDPLKR